MHYPSNKLLLGWYKPGTGDKTSILLDKLSLVIIHLDSRPLLFYGTVNNLLPWLSFTGHHLLMKLDLVCFIVPFANIPDSFLPFHISFLLCLFLFLLLFYFQHLPHICTIFSLILVLEHLVILVHPHPQLLISLLQLRTVYCLHN